MSRGNKRDLNVIGKKKPPIAMPLSNYKDQRYTPNIPCIRIYPPM